MSQWGRPANDVAPISGDDASGQLQITAQICRHHGKDHFGRRVQQWQGLWLPKIGRKVGCVVLFAMLRREFELLLWRRQASTAVARGVRTPAWSLGCGELLLACSSIISFSRYAWLFLSDPDLLDKGRRGLLESRQQRRDAGIGSNKDGLASGSDRAVNQGRDYTSFRARFDLIVRIDYSSLIPIKLFDDIIQIYQFIF